MKGPRASARLRRIRREIEHSLVFLVVDLEPRDELTSGDVAATVARLPADEDALEQLLLEIRYSINFEGSLAEVLGDDQLSDRVIRQLLFALEVEVVSRLTGEPKRRLPFEGPSFRSAPRPLSWFDA